MSDIKTIGIVGGMGPQAGVALLNKIIAHTPATVDQEHLSTVLASFPTNLVDRTAFLTGAVATNPAYGIANVIHKLYTVGARLIGIACNTAHAPTIYDVMMNELCRKKIDVTMVHMPLETCRAIQVHYPHAKRVGVMATTGTYVAGIYNALLKSFGYQVIRPDVGFQRDVIHSMIYDHQFGIKRNAQPIAREVFLRAAQAMLFFKEAGADVIIIGCTELSLVFNEHYTADIPFVDASTVLANALIQRAISHQHTHGSLPMSVMRSEMQRS